MPIFNSSLQIKITRVAFFSAPLASTNTIPFPHSRTPFVPRISLQLFNLHCRVDRVKLVSRNSIALNAETRTINCPLATLKLIRRRQTIILDQSSTVIKHIRGGSESERERERNKRRSPTPPRSIHNSENRSETTTSGWR